MNARELQQAVMKDLESLFSGDRYKTPLRTMEPIKTYAQQLPKFDAQEIDDFFPYAIVRIDKGGVENQTSPHKVDIMIIVGIFDDGTEPYTGEKENPEPGEQPSFIGEDGWDNRNFGNIAVLEALERIQSHYEMEPSLGNGKFYFDGPFHWVLQDETVFPYNIGACDLTFTLAAPRKERSKFT